ncbi:TlpA family protein disulfide reductase [Longispora albida]|uniref:TlpA family protein disulfide reductase n=1 Tax=Longispora albida TaxID=203523 RepID=UPI0003767A52|nr:TlpA disulfide reductase family protein [Longispora albida]
MKRVIPLVAVALLALAGCGDSGDAQKVTGQQRFVAGDGTTSVFGVAERKKAPAVAGKLLDDAGYTFTPGKVTVLNFWASWCAPCREEADDLEAVYQATKGSGVDFLGVDIRDGRDEAKNFVAGRFTYPSLFDPAGKVALKFRDVPPNTIPATFVIDRQGRIAVVIRKSVERDELRKLLDPIVAEQ